MIVLFANAAHATEFTAYIDVPKCDPVHVVLPNLATRAEVDLPLPGCRRYVLKATVQQGATATGPVWEAAFGIHRAGRPDEWLVQPTMVSPANTVALFISGYDRQGGWVRPGAPSTDPSQGSAYSFEGVSITWSVDESDGATATQ